MASVCFSCEGDFSEKHLVYCKSCITIVCQKCALKGHRDATRHEISDISHDDHLPALAKKLLEEMKWFTTNYPDVKSLIEHIEIIDNEMKSASKVKQHPKKFDIDYAEIDEKICTEDEAPTLQKLSRFRVMNARNEKALLSTIEGADENSKPLIGSVTLFKTEASALAEKKDVSTAMKEFKESPRMQKKAEEMDSREPTSSQLDASLSDIAPGCSSPETLGKGELPAQTAPEQPTGTIFNKAVEACVPAPPPPPPPPPPPVAIILTKVDAKESTKKSKGDLPSGAQIAFLGELSEALHRRQLATGTGAGAAVQVDAKESTKESKGEQPSETPVALLDELSETLCPGELATGTGAGAADQVDAKESTKESKGEKPSGPRIAFLGELSETLGRRQTRPASNVMPKPTKHGNQPYVEKTEENGKGVQPRKDGTGIKAELEKKLSLRRQSIRGGRESTDSENESEDKVSDHDQVCLIQSALFSAADSMCLPSQSSDSKDCCSDDTSGEDWK